MTDENGATQAQFHLPAKVAAHCLRQARDQPSVVSISMSRPSPVAAATSTTTPFMLSAAGHTDVGRRRKNNEDCFALVALGGGNAPPLPQATVEGPLAEPGVLLVVADGMGGAEAGEVASRLAVETVVAELRGKAASTADMAATLTEAVAIAHAAVFQTAERVSEYGGMGCTLSILWVRPGRAALAQVGDSRIYRWLAGQLEQLTRDQTVAQGMVVRGEITAEQAKEVRFRGVLEQVIGGNGEMPQPQVDEFEVARGDRFLLCSDGCHDCLDEIDLAARLGAADFEPAACVRDVVNEACRRSGHDNITVIAIACEEPRRSWRQTLARWLGRS